MARIEPLSLLQTPNDPNPSRIEQQHLPILAVATHLVTLHRDTIGIEPIWTIEVRICCPEEMPESEASIFWHAEVWYARMMVRCDVPEDLLSWLVIHELMELQRWRSTDLVHNALESAKIWSTTSVLWTIYAQRLNEARNQEVELAVSMYMQGERRPLHLDGHYTYRNVHQHTPKRPITQPLGKSISQATIPHSSESESEEEEEHL
jgi:hypothetical protein